MQLEKPFLNLNKIWSGRASKYSIKKFKFLKISRNFIGWDSKEV